MRLFKYAPLERVDILLNETIRYTQPSDLNDPYEMRLDFTSLTSDDYNLFWNQLKSLETKEAASRFYDAWPYADFVPATKEQVVDMIMRLVQNSTNLSKLAKSGEYSIPQTSPVLDAAVIANLDKTIGLLSLSEVPDNLLMWSHYADQHKGIVIEFDGDHDTFNKGRAANTVRNFLREVVYSEKRPTALIQHDATTLFFTKAPDWSYEKEWRILKPLSEAKITKNAQPFNIHLLDMPADCIKRVIFGARIPSERIIAEVAKIRSRTQLAHVRLTRAVRRLDRFGLSIDHEI